MSDLDTITEINVDGMKDAKHPEIEFWGKATKQIDGTWRCYANVGGNLCVVEVKPRLSEV